jgi:glycosidase
MTRSHVDYYPFGEYGTVWSAEIPAQPEGTWVRYRIEGAPASGKQILAQDGQGFWFRYEPSQSVTLFSFRVTGADLLPKWFRDAVVYQIFVDRFAGQRNPEAGPREKHGGTLEGITSNLPHLESLGVSCIWLSPVGDAPSYHRYDATDVFSVDPDLGTNDDLRTLVSRAHERGIRVILDFVPCHLSNKHPAFQAAVQDRDSQYSDWFVFYRWPDKYRSFLEMSPSLVSLNTASNGARAFIKKAARFWIEECGIDGFRLDHVIGHGMDFWNDLQISLEKVKPDVVTVGEATDTGDAVRRFAGHMNAVMDFPLARALRLTFGTGDWKPSQFEAFLSNHEQFMESGPARASFLDNHDMERFLYVAGQDTRALQRAALCMLTLAATPIIYYGTEIGLSEEDSFQNMEAGGDAQCRADMVWDKRKWNSDLFESFQQLIRIRNSSPVFREGSRELLGIDDATGLYHYRRVLHGAEYHIAFVLGHDAVDVTLSSAAKPILCLSGAPPRKKHKDLLPEGQSHWTLSPGTGVLFAYE